MKLISGSFGDSQLRSIVNDGKVDPTFAHVNKKSQIYLQLTYLIAGLQISEYEQKHGRCFSFKNHHHTHSNSIKITT